MHISILTLTAAAMLTALAFSAHADASRADPVIRGRSIVHYGDLDIDSQSGAEILLRRIERAAVEVCGGHVNFTTYTAVPDDTFEECRRGTIARTVKKLRAPTITRVYLESNRNNHGADAPKG
jgi:UrcA family protein